MQHLQRKFINIVRQAQHVVPALRQRLHLRQRIHRLAAFARRVIELLLSLRHVRRKLLQRVQLTVLAARKQQQVLQLLDFLLRAVHAAVDAQLQAAPILRPELFVLFAVIR